VSSASTLPEHPRAVRARLGVTLQETIGIETATVTENLRIFGRFYLLREPALSQRVDELLDFLDLRAYADAPVKMLSGGYKRPLAIAMSLINRPELLILDEPTTGLDPALRHTLWSRVWDLRAEGTTVLLTTHYMDEAERLCDRVVIIDQGQAMIEGSPRELINRELAREAVEVECTELEERALLEGLNGELKCLRAGNRLMLFADQTAPVVERIQAIDGGTQRPFVVRPANLEDVFLSLTGTRLREGA